jgi:predicted lipoprotein
MRPLTGPNRLGYAAILVLAGIVVHGSHIERRVVVPAGAGATPPPGGQFANPSFDAKAQVTDIWDSKVMPALREKVGDFNPLVAAMKANLDDAGAKHGHRERGEGAPWNFVTHLTGKIVAADTDLSAATVDVDTDGDGKADATVQIGPVLRGTSLRDALPFVSFTKSANQVEFAQLANAFNDEAYQRALKPLPRNDLVGKTVDLVGVFTTDDAADTPTITPVQLTLGSK